MESRALYIFINGIINFPHFKLYFLFRFNVLLSEKTISVIGLKDIRNTRKNSEFTVVISQGKSRRHLERITKASRTKLEQNSNKTRTNKDAENNKMAYRPPIFQASSLALIAWVAPFAARCGKGWLTSEPTF